ncbi:hypothetical protein SAMN05444274_107182 [Mariniphaga anaerophila]|uniref:Uncharacterized protein n=1 Tax=Mariniphaga anaerophila TaxID=1484053 RepID=A0A1M5DNK3_9BACT|nr:hypothetical protein SAMN05444274_107182 [Mariniphaga anaerophila]
MPMMKNSTLLFVFKKFYQNSVESSNIQRNVAETDLFEMKSAVFNPSVQSIQKILDFARAYDVVETEATGYVEMILN